MYNVTPVENVSMMVLFIAIPILMVTAIIELIVYFILKLFSKDTLITFKKPGIPSYKERISSISVGILAFVLNEMYTPGLKFNHSIVISIPFVIATVLLFANWRLGHHIYLLFKFRTDKE